MPDAPAQMPNARPCSSPWKLVVRMASEPGTRIAPAAPWSSRATIRNSMFGASPHRMDVMPKANQADDEDLAAAVVVGQRAGQDEQRAERQQVAVLDVVLALEDVDEEGGSLPIAGSATVTTEESRKTMQEPSTAAMSVQRLSAVIRRRGHTSAAILQSGRWHPS